MFGTYIYVGKRINPCDLSDCLTIIYFIVLYILYYTVLYNLFYCINVLNIFHLTYFNCQCLWFYLILILLEIFSILLFFIIIRLFFKCVH